MPWPWRRTNTKKANMPKGSGFLNDVVVVDKAEAIPRTRSMPDRASSNELNLSLSNAGEKVKKAPNPVIQKNAAPMEKEKDRDSVMSRNSDAMVPKQNPVPEKIPGMSERELEYQEVENVIPGPEDNDSDRGDRMIVDPNEKENVLPNIGDNDSDWGDRMIPDPEEEEQKIPEPEPNVAPFVPQHAPQDQWSTAGMMVNGTARLVGNALGVPIVGLATNVTNIAHPIIRYRVKKQVQEGQKRRHHKLVPGREDETFASNPGRGGVLGDFRRVPTVWSYLTAGKATENGREDGRDVPPKLSVYVRQPKTGSSQTMNHSIGHAMLGIEYTRPSKITGKKERYNIQYGFYPAGGIIALNSALMMGHGAVIPGKLMDDHEETYDVSKSYTVDERHAEAVAAASEKYTEQGGYGYYTRNCATFVRDMFRVGGIPDNTVDQIFREEFVRFDAKSNGGFLLGNGLRFWADTNTQRKLGDLTKKDDLSYEGWGNKRVTKQDFSRYIATKNSAGFGVKSLSPAAAGENIRRMNDVRGQLGSYRYVSQSLRNPDKPKEEADKVDPSYGNLLHAIRVESRAVMDKIYTLVPAGQLQEADKDFRKWLASLPTYGDGIGIICNEFYKVLAGLPDDERDNAEPDDYVMPARFREAYEKTEAEMAMLSLYYQKFFKSDSRLNTEVMNLLSTLQIALSTINMTYGRQGKASDRGELGTLREDMTLCQYTIRVDGMEAVMTPTHYESYLQIYGEPKKAVQAYKRYLELKRESEIGALSRQKRSEFDALQRKENLAEEFDKSHREMLNKDDFSQRDIDYAFNLKIKESGGRVGATSGTMHTEHASASMTYIALIYDKIFGGVQESARQAAENGTLDASHLPSEVAWLDQYLLDKTARESDRIVMILRGIKRTTSKPTAKYLRDSFHHFMINNYLVRAFPSKSSIENIGQMIEVCYDTMRGENREFPRLIDLLILSVLQEKEEIKPRAVKKNARK